MELKDFTEKEQEMIKKGLRRLRLVTRKLRENSCTCPTRLD